MGRLDRLRAEFEAIKNNPRNTEYRRIAALLRGLGYIDRRNKKQSHHTFSHPQCGSQIHIAEPHPGNVIRRVYVNDVVAEIERHPELWEGENN